MPAIAQDCRQALVLGLDVSLSVNTNDFALQRTGLARALVHPDVMDALLGSPGTHVELAVFEWTGQYNQNILVDWVVIDSRRTINAIATILAEKPQNLRSGKTAIGAAMRYARDLLNTRRHCTNLTLDLSGDGKNNNGVPPQSVQAEMDDAGIVVNGLVIEAPTEGKSERVCVGSCLAGYFQDNVIVGPASFVEAIVGFENYETAIRRKLLRELTPSLARVE